MSRRRGFPGRGDGDWKGRWSSVVAGMDCRLPDGKVVFVSKEAKEAVESAPVLLRDLNAASMAISKSAAILSKLEFDLR